MLSQTSGFLMCSGSVKRDQWYEIGYMALLQLIYQWLASCQFYDMFDDFVWNSSLNEYYIENLRFDTLQLSLHYAAIFFYYNFHLPCANVHVWFVTSLNCFESSTFRNSRLDLFRKKMFLKILQNLQENKCAGVSF